jgi:hypothetical protein
MENGKWKMENETNQAGLTALAGGSGTSPAKAGRKVSIFHSPLNPFSINLRIQWTAFCQW